MNLLLASILDAQVTCKLLSRLILKGTISDLCDTPDFLNRRRELSFFLLYFLDSYFVKSQGKRQKLRDKLQNSLIKDIHRSGNRSASGQVNTLTVDELANTSLETLLLKGEPFIVKGLFADSPAVKKWSIDHFVNNYGDIDVLGGSSTTGSHSLTKLKNIKDDDDLYIRNIETLFLKDKTLVKDLDLGRLDKYHLPEGFWLHCLQMFLANSPKANSAYHCASPDNFFIMLNGEKKWWFVNPIYTHSMMPRFNKGMAYFESSVGNPEKPNPDIPGYKDLPVLEGYLKPGDFLYIPSLWWHGVQNQTPNNIAVSSRWFWMKNGGSNYYLLTLLQALSVNFFSTEVQFLEETRKHLRKFGKLVNFHDDRNYVSFYDEKTGRTMFENASHQEEYKDTKTSV